MAKSVFTPVRTRTARARALAAAVAMSLIAALLIPFTATPAGAAPVTDPNISAGKAGTLFTLTFSSMEALLLDTSNFGPAGTEVVTSLSIKPEAERVTAEYLSDVDIFFDGWVFTDQWQTDEINSIDEWVTRGGVIILTEDASFSDELGTLFGAPTIAEVGVDDTEGVVEVLSPATGQEAHPMVAGPFGTITTMAPFGTLGHLGAPGSLGVDWTTIYVDQDGNAVVAVRDWGLGHVILTTDEGIFRDTNAAAAMNIFSYALTFTEDTLVPISVDAQTDQAFPVGDPITDLTTGTTGGDASSPIVWRAADLPPGLAVSSTTGTISGTPTTGGTYDVVLTASPPTGLEGSTSFTICVGDLMVTNPGAQTDRERDAVAPTVEMEASGGDCTTAITWDDGGTLPAGLSIDPNTGEISGTPTTAGTSNVEITASQGATDVTVMFDWTITDNPEPVAVADSVTVDFGVAINLDLCANDTLADTPTTAAITGALPAGVSQTDCVLSGTPSAAGTTNLTYVLTDDDGDMSAPAAITITVNAMDLLPVAVADQVTVDFGAAINLNLCANDTLGDTPTTAAITGTFPAGVTQAGCVLSGTPAASGTTNLTYVLTDNDGDMSAPAAITITVNAEPDPDPDPVFCRGREATIVGTEGPDVLTGTDGPDVIVGLGGNDTIRGAGGDDLVCAGPGDDTVFGGGGADEIWGNSGDDTIRGNSGQDTIRGGSGDDNIRGNKARDTILGGSGADEIHGGSAADDIRGNKGRDTIRGGTGADDIHGGSAADTIFGQSGNDDLIGGTGADSLDGGSGTDTCNGGSGSDTSTGCETRISAIRFI